MAARQYRSTVEAKTLSAAINSSVTSMTLNSVTTLPSTYQYTLVIDPDTATEEIVTVTANSGGNTLTIVRGQDGTSAQAHAAAAVVKHMITARDLQEPQDHIAATTNVHGVTGAIAPLASPTFTGTPLSTTAAVDTNTTQIATTAYVVGQGYAKLASPTFTGTPTIPTGTIATTQTAGNSTTAVATTAFVTTADNLKANLASPTFTGTVVLPSTTSIGNVTSTEIGYVDGVTSAIQTQLDAKATTSALTSHEADTTSIHGITDTSKLAKFGSSAAGRTIFVQTTTPTPVALGDIWIDY
jgi:hypothetical protein